MGQLRLLGIWLWCAMFTPYALAQQQLVVDGIPVAGLTTELVPGTAYAPAQTYAQALGASYRFDPQSGVLLEFGGRYLSLASFDDSNRAAEAENALTLGGAPLPGPGAVVRAGSAYLPIKRVTEVLGGMTAYLEPQQTVVVVFPRPQLLGVTPPNIWGSSERFVLSFSAPISLEVLYESSLRFVRFRFPRAGLENLPAALERFSGSRFSDAAFIPETDYLDFNLTLREGNTYSVFSEPSGEGSRVVIDVFGDNGAVSAGQPSLLLRAGAGTEALASSLREVLAARGVNVGVAQGDDTFGEVRSGVAAPFLLALGRTPLMADGFNLYYLADSASVPLLDAPLRRSSTQGTLSGPERTRLADLAPDLAWGERAAAQLADSLEASTSLRRGQVLAAPLLALSAAAGRGVLLELSPAALADPSLVTPLATSLAALARRP